MITAPKYTGPDLQRGAVVEYEGLRLGPEFVALHWEAMEKELDRIPHTWAAHWTKQSMFEMLMAGGWQAWGFGPKDQVRVTVFTTVAHFPAGRSLQILLAFGNSIDVLLPTIEATFERFAIEADCFMCEIQGRMGWERKLKGFRRAAVVLRKNVVRQGVH